MTNKQLKQMFSQFLISLLVLGGIALLVWFVIVPRVRNLGNPFTPHGEVIAFHDYFSLNPDRATIVLDNIIHRDAIAPLIHEVAGEVLVYLPASFLRQLDQFIFWDNSANALFISTRYEMLEFVPGRANFYVNGVTRSILNPVLREDGEVFLPADLVEGLYPLRIEYMPEYSIVAITSVLEPFVVARVSVNETNLRYRAESRSPLAATLSQGDEVIVFEGAADNEDFVLVRTATGIVGYLLADEIGNSSTRNIAIGRTSILSGWIDNKVQHPPNWRGGAINMVWESVHNPDANNNRMQLPFHPSVNVVSPTWLNFDRENFRLSSHVSRAYVEWAQAQGVYVWPKVMDVNNASARAILMNRDARRTVVAQILHYVDTYNLDGINIDIEHLLVAEEGPYKIQFLRELAIPMRERGVVLSAAVKIPAPWTMFYRRDLIGLTVDFVMVMTYDEHVASSENAGPVASLTWVHEAIVNMLDEVPREKLVMGLPFYNRAWRETMLDDEPHRALGWTMDHARYFFESENVDWVWDSQVGSYFGEIVRVEDGQAVAYRIWLECARSITEKMQIFSVHSLAGVAGWARTFETAEVWEVIARFL